MFDMLVAKTEFDEQKWNQRLEFLMNVNEEETTVLRRYHLDRIASRLKKEFGEITVGQEDVYLDGLEVYENNLLCLAQRYELNSRDLKKIVEIWMYMLYGSYHGNAYDFSYVAEEDTIGMARIMDRNSNALHNEEVLENARSKYPDVDFDKKENLYDTLVMGLLILEKIHSSMQFWEKEFGSNGYLTYLEKFEAGEFDNIQF